MSILKKIKGAVTKKGQPKATKAKTAVKSSKRGARARVMLNDGSKRVALADVVNNMIAKTGEDYKVAYMRSYMRFRAGHTTLKDILK